MQDFKFGAVYKACVISYETLRKFAKDLSGSCDILICDEGHRSAHARMMTRAS